MSITYPHIFIMLIIPYIIFAFLVLTNKEGIERVFSQKALKHIKIEGDTLSSRARNVIFFISIFFMIIAASGPYIDRGEKNIKLSGISLTFALDISASMRCKDVYPNRLNFAKIKIKEMLKELPQDEIMLITFSKNVFLVSPFTTDKQTLTDVLDGITDEYLLSSSNFTALANVLKKKLHNKKEKIVVIFSDGAEKRDLLQFEKIIKSENITLYAVLTGTKEGAMVLDEKNRPLLVNYNPVYSKVNEYLGKIAKESGGDYIIADYDNSKIYNLAKEIKTKFHATNSGKYVKIEDRVQLFYYFIIAALVFLLAAFVSVPTFEKRGRE